MQAANTIGMRKVAWLAMISVGVVGCAALEARVPAAEGLMQRQAAQRLAQVFWSSGACPSSTEVTVWGQVAQRPMGELAMRRRAEALLKGIGSAWSTKETKLTRGHGGDADKLVAKCYHARGYRLMLSLQSVPGETYMVASAWLENPRDSRDLSVLTDVLIPLAHRACQSYSVTQSLTGYFAGSLSVAAMNATAKGTLTELRAKTNGRVSGPSHVSLSGYSSELWNTVSAGRSKVNVNVALRQDLTTRRTWLVLASPVIVDEY